VHKVAVIIGLFAAVMIAILLASPGQFGKSSAYDQYVCTVCGLKRADEVRKLGPITCRRRVIFEESSVSRALRVKECQHSWLLYRYGHSFRGLLVGWHADGGCQSLAVPALLQDNAFALNLAQMESPGKTWGSLVAALNSSRAFDEAFLEWRHDSENGTFSSWAATNGYWFPATNR